MSFLMKIPILGGIFALSAYKIIMSIWERHINNLNIDIILEDNVGRTESVLRLEVNQNL